MGMIKTPLSFRTSVETRLKQATGANNGPALQRRRVLLVMERFIARLSLIFPDSAMLKGGLALELRVDGARTTKDIDVRLQGTPNSSISICAKSRPTVPIRTTTLSSRFVLTLTIQILAATP